jgi:hypothetical protein
MKLPKKVQAPSTAKMDEVATDALNRVARAAEEISRLQPRLDRARTELHESIKEAHREGATAAVLVRVSGLSRQRISQILANGD